MNALSKSRDLLAEFERLIALNTRLAERERENVRELEAELKFGDQDQIKKIELLTDKEKEVFDLIAKGLKPAEIGERLKRAQKTVESQRTAIISKLGLENVAALEAFAQRQNGN